MIVLTIIWPPSSFYSKTCQKCMFGIFARPHVLSSVLPLWGCGPPDSQLWLRSKAVPHPPTRKQPSWTPRGCFVFGRWGKTDGHERISHRMREPRKLGRICERNIHLICFYLIKYSNLKMRNYLSRACVVYLSENANF